MEIQQIPVSKIKPDPSQPRKFIDNNRVKEMSVSIKNEGVINPIEIDENFVIITGELRWRAARYAGLEKIPVKVLKIAGMERFIRQMQENAHHNTMSVLDTARALKKVQEWIIRTKVKTTLVRDKKHQGERYQKYTKELSDLFGYPTSHISRMLKLLEEPEDIQKILHNRQEIPVIGFGAIRTLPMAYQDKLKKKMLIENIPTVGVRYIVKHLKQLDREKNYTRANELLKRNYRGMEANEIIVELSRVSKGIAYLENDQEAARQIRETTETLSKMLHKRPIHTFKPLFRVTLTAGMTLFAWELLEWLQDKSKVKQLLEK